MGVDYDGGMIVGEKGELLTVDGELNDLLEDHEMDTMSPWYDASPEYCVFGFTVEDVSVDAMVGEWLSDVKSKAERFEKITGTKARLIGIQNIW